MFVAVVGYESPKWLGKCPACNEWNTFYEEKDVEKKGTSSSSKKDRTEPIQLNKVEKKATTRIKTGIEELDRVLGGGFVKGSLVLLRWRAWNWQVNFNFTNLR